MDDFDAARQYLYYNRNTQHVEILGNTTYVAAVGRQIHYTAEPISQPNIVGTITGVTAGAGLAGGGDSGQVSLDLDETAADFPVVPVLKGGTGAITAAAARTALGLDALLTALAPLADPALTGVPTVPTAAAGTSTVQAANTQFVVAAIAAAMLGGGSDGVLSVATYDDATEELVLTLSTGTVLRVPLMALVSGFLDSAGATALIATWARAVNPSGEIPEGSIPAAITRDAELPSMRSSRGRRSRGRSPVSPQRTMPI